MGADAKVYDMHEIRCNMPGCKRYLGTLKIKVDPDRLAYEDGGTSKDITLAELENLTCPRCGKKSELSIVIGRKIQK